MKKRIKYLIFILLLFLVMIPSVTAKENLNLYLFWGDGCPHCAKEKEYLANLEKEFPNLHITEYEVWNNKENAEFLQEIAFKTNHSIKGVPVTIIGKTIISGFSTTTEHELRRAVSYYSENKHQDTVEEIKNGTYQEPKDTQEDPFQQEEQNLNEKTTATIPIVGEINFKNYDLMTASPILGILASISLPIIWLIITLVSSINLQTKKTQKKSLVLAIIMFIFSSIIFQKVSIPSIAIIGKIGIITLSTIIVITKIKNIPLLPIIEIIIPILFAIAIGMLTSSDYITIFSTLLKTNNLSFITELLNNFYYYFSYSILYILIFILYCILWNKIKFQHKKIIPFCFLIITIALIIWI